MSPRTFILPCILALAILTVPVPVPAEPPAEPPAETTTHNPAPDANADLKREIEELRRQVDTLVQAADVRQSLTETDAEKREKEENILNAAGREYTLMQEGKLGFEYQLAYSYFRYDAIRESGVIEHNSNHNFKNTFIFEYPVKNNLTAGSRIPFVYEYDQIGAENEKDVTDFGDVAFYADYQPVKSGGNVPSVILTTQLTCPMGRSPYEVNPEEDLATGSGGYSALFSVNASKSLDPVLAYGSLSYEKNFPINNIDYKMAPYTMEKYEPGDTIGVSIGMGFALSYKTSLSLGYSQSFSLKSTRYFKETAPKRYPTTSESTLSVGTAWRLDNNRRVNVYLSTGLSNSGSHSISCSFPMEFNL